METQLIQSGMMGINQGRLPCVEVKVERGKACLGLPCLPSMSKTLVPYPFVESVLVDEQQLIPCLNQNVRVSKLSKRLHVRQVVQFPLKRLFVSGTALVPLSGVSVKVSFGRRQGCSDRLLILAGEQGLPQR